MRSRIHFAGFVVALGLTVGPRAAFAQSRAELLAMAAQHDSVWTAQQPQRSFPLLRVAKWSVLAGSAGAAFWGFVQNERADERYRALEQQCEAEPERCKRRTPDGAYEDPEFEQRFQEVRSLDRKSHRALLIGQIGLAASVALFLLDLGNVEPPPDIPYDPRLSVIDGRTRLTFSVPLGSR